MNRGKLMEGTMDLKWYEDGYAEYWERIMSYLIELHQLYGGSAGGGM